MIALKQIKKTFTVNKGTVTALDDVSLTIEKGEIFGIIGRSGAGKSTLIRMIDLLERPTSSRSRSKDRTSRNSAKRSSRSSGTASG